MFAVIWLLRTAYKVTTSTLETKLLIFYFLQLYQCTMARTSSVIMLAAAIFINTLSCCSTGKVHCVTSTDTSCSFCPQNYSHCATLSEYAQESKLFFTSNTTMVFLAGNHVLGENITVENLTRLAMYGDSYVGNKATIVCNGSYGLSFTNMVELRIYSLAFTSCNRHYGNFQVGNYALRLQSTQNAELVNCSFHDNLGTALVVNNTGLTITGNSDFTRNHCELNCAGGGAVLALNSSLTITGNTTFFENFAYSARFYVCGGAIYASDNTIVHFNGNNNFTSNYATLGQGGAIYSSGNTFMFFNGTNNFINNYVGGVYGGGGAIYTVYSTVLSFSGTSNFISNSAYASGGAIYTSDNTTLSFNGLSNFIDNLSYMGGAIYAYFSTTLSLNRTINFTNNGPHRSDEIVAYGGGVVMGFKSFFSILPNTTVYWESNHATLGGALYVLDGSPLSYCTSVAVYVEKEQCFFQLPGQNLSSNIDVQLVFKNNSAVAAGSLLYGGAIDNCKLNNLLHSYSSGKVFDMLVHNSDTHYNTISNISSNPFNICPCEHNRPVCNIRRIKHTAYPGETFQVSVVAVGQRKGTIPATVRSVSYDNYYLLNSQYLQKVNNTCTKIKYTVFSLSKNALIDLQADSSSCSRYGNADQLRISVTLNQTCPTGFDISESIRSCVCEPRLARYAGKHQCNIANGLGQITRNSGQQFWVGYDNQSDGLILHPHCPFDYCINDTVVFPLNNTDMQCVNRSGLLCGACKKGYSLVLSTFQCKLCSNSHLVLLIPFALMGVALVFLLLVCKLSVATGMLSGLVLYANIIEANHATFLPGNPILSVFIAWLNLDFGIETCFYNGMDAYSKTWLQFVFPVYIWVLVGLVILFSNCSRRFAKLLGNNPVSVLATLILLSYTKILSTLTTAIKMTYLQYPTYNRMVWLYDANIGYLSGKHIPLFLVAVLVFFILFLPYTLLLLFGQWLQTLSHLRLFSWVNNTRLNAFMDSYYAPYKAKHRYWPGLLLVLRFVLLLVIAFNFQEDPKTNLLATLIEIANLFLWLWITGGVYTNWYINVLEGFFAVNLIILTAVTYCVNLLGASQLIIGYTWTTSVSIALAIFIGILIFQLASVTGIAEYVKRKCTAIKLATKVQNKTKKVVESPTSSLPDRLINPSEYEPLPYIPQGHAIAEEVEGEAEKSVNPVYIYGSIS